MKPQTNEGRVNLRRRTERPGRQAEEALDRRVAADQHGQDAVPAGARDSRQSIRDFVLQHHGCVAERQAGAKPVDELEQNWRRDVVWEIAHDAQRSGRALGNRPGRVEEIAFDDPHVGRGGRFEIRGEIAVDFERNHRLRESRQRTRQRAAPGPDLEKRLVRFRINRAQEFLDPDRLEKVLAEALPRDALQRKVPVMRFAGSVVTTPVFFLDLFDFLFAQPEIMPDLVNQCFANRDDQIVLVV